MNLKQNEEFNDYVEKYKKLKLNDKQDVIITLLKEDITFLEKLLELKNIKPEILYNREILDTNNKNYNEDDFAEAVLVYCYSIRELLATYVEKEEL